MTFRDLLNEMSRLTDEQLNQEVKIIPTGYAVECPVDFGGFEPFPGKIELDVPKGDIVYIDEDNYVAGVSLGGTFDSSDAPEQEYSDEEVAVRAGMPYLKISNAD